MQVKNQISNNSYFVNPSIEVNNDFSSTMIIDNFKFANVTMFHHNTQKFDDDF